MMKHNEWQQFVGQLTPDTDLLIDGKWSKSSDGGEIPSINPSTGEVIANIASATEADIERATAVAKARFEQGAWSRMALRKRMRT